VSLSCETGGSGTIYSSCSCYLLQFAIDRQQPSLQVNEQSREPPDLWCIQLPIHIQLPRKKPCEFPHGVDFSSHVVLGCASHMVIIGSTSHSRTNIFRRGIDTFVQVTMLGSGDLTKQRKQRCDHPLYAGFQRQVQQQQFHASLHQLKAK
jgi:hypothetical protein